MPELIVEVVSGGTATRDRVEKKAIYERNGVLEYWLVDPRAEEVIVFHAVAGCFDAGCVCAVNDRLSSQVLAGLAIVVRDLMPLP